MTRGRFGAALLLAILIAAAALAFSRSHAPQTKRADRPALLLLTSLPLMFGEDFSLENGGSPALRTLQRHYRVVPISVTSGPELAKGGLLLMAHPQAQTAENLVTLDRWVRGGGRVLLLADPMLEWPSKRPLGDLLRPPPMFMDTGLLEHWGLRLDAPDVRGPVLVGGGHGLVVFVSPGRLLTDRSNCVLSRSGIVAECKIGRGRAVVVADADFLNPEIATLRNSPTDNMAELIALLDSTAAK